MIQALKFKRDKSKDLFADPKQLAEIATSLGKTVEEYYDLYSSNLEAAQYYNCAANFRAKIVDVYVSKKQNDANVAILKFISGPTDDIQEIKIGLVTQNSKSKEKDLAKLLKDNIGKNVILTKSYRGTEDNQFKFLLNAKIL